MKGRIVKYLILLGGIITALVVHWPGPVCAQALSELRLVSEGRRASFRGASVVDDSVAWVSGSNSTVLRTTDGGKSWHQVQVSGYDSLDFRSLYAFDSLHALIANAGSPAYILKTSDGGRTWIQVYFNNHPDAFIDGMDFWNSSQGLIYGDPINGKMLLLKTNDGGKTWKSLAETAPVLEKGEASFAASGTGIRCMGEGRAVIATGGVKSRLWMSDDRGKTWRSQSVPVLQGQPSTGIYSVAFDTKRNGVIVGGDYTIDSLKKDHVFLTSDGGRSWERPGSPTGGYRECVEYANSKTVFAVGPSGIDISEDGGITFKSFSKIKGFHVLRKARKGRLLIVAGSRGQVAVIR